jgi:hypothetical protein
VYQIADAQRFNVPASAAKQKWWMCEFRYRDVPDSNSSANEAGVRESFEAGGRLLNIM